MYPDVFWYSKFENECQPRRPVDLHRHDTSQAGNRCPRKGDAPAGIGSRHLHGTCLPSPRSPSCRHVRRPEAEAAAIRAAFEQRGEFAAAVELRRLFPGVIDNARARECARAIAGWKPVPLLPVKRMPKPQLRRAR